MTAKICDQALDPGHLKDEEEWSGSAPVQLHPMTLDTLYLRYRTGLLAHLQSMVRDVDIAEELLHDTFLRLSRMPGLGDINQPKAFLFRIAGNLAIDHLRQCRRAPEGAGESELEELESPEPDQLELLVQARRRRQLRQAIDQLPPRARETLLLVRYRELTLREAAQELGISQTMVEKHLKNALVKCRELLQF
ncbi:DNA-directed RNA polymerase sigma-70 factor [Marinobacterium zhoushanense]|uniref:DNA-directed RNA polymerase sigma-70 factor n=1 Tax=Marinobacterium zhoushanense TaxID=1679163 RepID=A0ABQ1KQI1_9GAMM|nr:RNA polymerase sigma factor [Marinobacterium zhoushanense]GGC04614.1 DNA-directed RNA polymerase sigma-70 factor [Marinobacterium zhoushanense]